MGNRIFVGLVGVLVLLALAVRLPYAGTVMTADESNWMLRAGTYWHELLQGNPGGTFLTSHPGATTMAIAGAGIVWQEQRLGYDIDTSNLGDFRRAAAVPIVIVTALLLGVLVLAARPVVGAASALGGGLFVVADAYISGMSGLVHLDALLALTMAIAVMGLLAYLRESKRSWLTMAAIAAGLALVTKAVIALWLAPFALGTVGWFLYARSQDRKKLVVDAGIALLVVVITVGMFWPAVWAKNDWWRSVERDVVNVVTDEHVAVEISRQPIAPASFYLRTVVGRPPIYVGIVLVGAVALLFRLRRMPSTARLPLAVFLLYSVGFLIALSFAAKKADRYALPALTMLAFMSGWLVPIGLRAVAQRLRMPRTWQLGGTFGFIMLLLIPVLIAGPHASATMNPLGQYITPYTQQGWGEGLENVAAWLNTHPRATELRVASWYPTVFGSYFVGNTFSLSSRNDNRVSYIVTYRNMEGREHDDIASNVLDELRDRLPVYIQYVNGLPFAWVYKTDSVVLYDKHVGEITGESEVGQLLPITTDTVSAIDITFATFSSRNNTEDVIVRVYDAETNEVLREATIAATEIEDRSWHTFAIDPLEGMYGKSIIVGVSSPTSVPGNAVTVIYGNNIGDPGTLIRRTGQGTWKPSNQADLAVRIR